MGNWIIKGIFLGTTRYLPDFGYSMAGTLQSTPDGYLISLDNGIFVADVIEHLGREGIPLAKLQPLLFPIAIGPDPVARHHLSQSVGVHAVGERMQHLFLIHFASGFQMLRFHGRNLSVCAQQ